MPVSKFEIVDSTLLHVWLCIKNELIILQQKEPNEQRGQIVNPVSGAVYAQNTAAAALVLAVDYFRTGILESLTSAQQAIDSLSKINISSGLDEPKWSRIGWYNNEGSMFATGTLLDAYWKAQDLLQINADNKDFQSLLQYIESCRISKGLYTHDSLKPGQKPLPVQNTTAIALYLLEFVLAHTDYSSRKLRIECDSIAESLIRGQRVDGLWPYIYPLPLQRIIFRFPTVWKFLRHIPILRRFLIGAGDTSILFGDMVHHCIVLYYFSKSITLHPQPGKECKKAISKGWEWVQGHLIDIGKGELKVDFSWEPVPTNFRYANFGDTSTYFLILAMLSFLIELGVISLEDYHKFSSGILRHVENNLIVSVDSPTIIKPYEGPEEILKYILPRVGEASAWKGALLSEFLINRQKVIG